MTAQTSDVYGGDIRPDNSDEIDLRRYFLVLLKWWREILVISILAGAITGAALIWINSTKTPTYKASADILIARLLSNIELDDRVSTTSSTSQMDANSWRTSLLQLAKSSVVANAVYEELKDELPSTLQTPASLIDVIESTSPQSADERYASNIIRISATTSDPELSAKIANSWTTHLVAHINGLYGEVPEATIDSVSTERETALQEYQAAQAAYQDFVASNHISGLDRQILEKTTLRDEIMLSYNRMLTTTVSTEYDARLKLYTALTNAPVDYATALVASQSAGTVNSLAMLYKLRDAAIAQLNQARLMERSLVDGGEAAAKSNVAALQVLKLAAFATIHQTDFFPATLSVGNLTQEVEMTLEEQLVDVRSLVAVLEEYVAQLETDIKQAAESTMVGADLAAVGGLQAAPADGEGTAPDAAMPPSYEQLLAYRKLLDQISVEIGANVDDAHEQLLTTLETEIRQLQAEMSAERAKERQLTHQRDLAWTTYDTVGNKLQELNLLRSSANSEVRIGNLANVPRVPQPQTNPLLPVAALTLLGFFAAVFLALLVDSLGGMPFFARRTA